MAIHEKSSSALQSSASAAVRGGLLDLFFELRSIPPALDNSAPPASARLPAALAFCRVRYFPPPPVRRRAGAGHRVALLAVERRARPAPDHADEPAEPGADLNGRSKGLALFL